MIAWYDDIDTATLQRIKTYSAFNDPESKNLMVQTMYEYRQEEIAELEKENAELKEQLKPENCIEYLARGGYVKFLCENGNEHNQLTKAKELLEKLLVTSCNSDVLNLLPNCSEVLKVRVEAEQFLNSEVQK